MEYKWKLNDNNFSFWDRLKICAFFLNPNNFWTQNKKVQEFEKQMAKLVYFKYAIFVSSGSAANTILAMYLRDKLKRENSQRNIVILPSTTWTTSCSPWIREGFKPHFIDISLENFGMDLIKVNEFLAKNHKRVAAIFPTSLLGFNIDYNKLKNIKDIYPQIEIFVDQCENNFGGFDAFTSTTSTYMGHQIQSVEGGFVFTNNLEEYFQFLMYRNHGMVRSLPENNYKLGYQNKRVDSRFDFYSLGNNFRNSDIHALIGLLDIKKAYKHIKNRRRLYGLFQSNLNKDRYILPPDTSYSNSSWCVPFCLPIICKNGTSEKRIKIIKSYCEQHGIETRPIISGFLGYQTAYQGLMDEKDFPNSVYLHNYGIYVGLHDGVKEKDIMDLTENLNRI